MCLTRCCSSSSGVVGRQSDLSYDSYQDEVEVDGLPEGWVATEKAYGDNNTSYGKTYTRYASPCGTQDGSQNETPEETWKSRLRSL